MRHLTTSSAALAIAVALLLSGCSGSGGGGATSLADACATLKSALTEVSDDVQSALEGAADPSEVQADLEGYAESVDALAASAENADVSEVLDTLSGKLSDVAAKVATLPTDAEGKLDPDATAEQQAAIEETVAKVSAACTESTGGTDG
jgi:hypothetical protein